MAHVTVAGDLVMIAAAKEIARRARAAEAGVARERQCAVCQDAKWVKTYTPWGCPTSIPCPLCHRATAERPK